jgi:hypothetical protein
VLGPTLEVEAVVGVQQVGGLAGQGGAEGAAAPVLQVVALRLAAPAVDVPGHFQEVAGADLGGLDVADIGDPDVARALVPGVDHLFLHQGRRGRAQPQIGQREAQIRQVIVDAGPARALGLLVAGELPDIAEIVIRPDDGDVVRDLHARSVDLQYLLVGHEDLRDFRDVR